MQLDDVPAFCGQTIRAWECFWKISRYGGSPVPFYLYAKCFIRVVVKFRIGTDPHISLSKMSLKFCIGIAADPYTLTLMCTTLINNKCAKFRKYVHTRYVVSESEEMHHHLDHVTSSFCSALP